MYDPLVVDTFVAVHRDIKPELLTTRATLSGQLLNEITASSLGHSPDSQTLDEITASANETVQMFELAGTLGRQPTVSDLANAVGQRMRRLVPYTLFVFWEYDVSRDELEATYAVGTQAASVRGIRVPLGQRLSGWVAANRQTILNSDAVLDLGDIARGAEPRLRSCLSTALLSDDDLFGVLTLYSSDAQGFTENHGRRLEAVSHQVAPKVRALADSMRHRVEQSAAGVNSTAPERSEKRRSSVH